MIQVRAFSPLRYSSIDKEIHADIKGPPPDCCITIECGKVEGVPAGFCATSCPRPGKAARYLIFPLLEEFSTKADKKSLDSIRTLVPAYEGAPVVWAVK